MCDIKNIQIRHEIIKPCTKFPGTFVTKMSKTIFCSQVEKSGNYSIGGEKTRTT